MFWELWALLGTVGTLVNSWALLGTLGTLGHYGHSWDLLGTPGHSGHSWFYTFRHFFPMRIHTPTFPCERDWCRSMMARAVGADEHLAGDLHHICMDERNGCHRAAGGWWQLRRGGGGGGGGGSSFSGGDGRWDFANGDQLL